MHALRVLEFSAIRDRLQSHCETTIGAAEARELLPSFDADEVWRRLASTQEAHDALAKHSVPSLGAIRDLRQAADRAGKGAVLGGQELFCIGDSLATMRTLRTFLIGRRADMPLLSPYAEALPEQKRIEEQLLDSLDGDGTIKDAASPQIASLRAGKKSAALRIQERIQSFTTGKTRDLLSDPIYTVRDGRFVIPLKAENRGKIRGIVHDTSGSGQTIYIEPEEVLQLGNALREIEAAERAEEVRILTLLSSKVGTIAQDFIYGLEAAGVLDFAFAKARLGYEMHGTLPQKLPQAASIQIQKGKHPLLDPEKVVPLDIDVSPQKSVLITGPNTGGKTVAIKCVGLFVLMAQSGLMPPAIDLKLGPFSSVWADIGDEQSLQQSLSTFGAHIKNISEALHGLKKGALVLLDEIGAGTDPAEGAALAKSLLEEMNAKGAVVLASTHYGELKAFAFNTPGFDNAAMEFDPKTLRPTYRLIMGAPGASHALKIAERYGISKEILAKAKDGLGDQAQDMARMMEQLETAQRLARIAQGEADRRIAEARKTEQKAAHKLAEADEIRQSVRAKANDVIEAALREIRLEAAQLFEDLKKTPGDMKAREGVRKSLKDLDEIGHDFAAEFAPTAPRRGLEPVLTRGATVRLEGYAQTGTVLDDVKGGQVTVQMGVLKMTVAVNRLQVVEKPSEKVKAKPNLRLQKALQTKREIDLRHQRAEEAERELERFLDDALLAGIDAVRIVHGKGEGILRKVTQDYLRRHPAVSAYRDGDATEGGSGVTIAEFA